MDACFSRHKCGVNVTPRKHAKLEASITSVPSTKRGPPSVSLLRLCPVPIHSSLGLILNGLPTFHDQYPACSVPIHPSTLRCCEIRSGYRPACCRRKHIMSHHAWLPSLQDRPCTIKTIADLRRIPVERSMSPAWWKTKLRRRSHSMLPVTYDLNQASTRARTPRDRSSRANSSSWSTVSNAAVKSNKQRADVCPLSVAFNKSSYTLMSECCLSAMVLSVSQLVCWHAAICIEKCLQLRMNCSF